MPSRVGFKVSQKIFTFFALLQFFDVPLDPHLPRNDVEIC